MQPRRFCAAVGMLAAAAAAAAAATPSPAEAEPWEEHRVLSRPVPMAAISLREITEAATTAEFFGRLTALGFVCAAEDSRYRNLRRVEVTCADGAGRVFVYAGGWSVGADRFTVDRIIADRDLLGGRGVGEHVRAVLEGRVP